MHIRVPEARKQPGISYAVTSDGIELPVIDITHPAFDPSPLEARLPALAEAFVANDRRRQQAPPWLGKLFLKIFLRKSVLARGLQRAEGSFLSGLSTYLFKLGPENLGAYAAPVDRLIAAALPAASIRLRLMDVARFLADGVQPALEARPGRPLRLVNIGGGPSIDSLNALILLHRRGALAGRQIQVLTLDLEPAGASFGAAALAALKAPGGALHGVDASLTRKPYDWTRPEHLRELLAGVQEGDAAVGASSEGALLEYAEDAHVEANLTALREATPSGTVFAGTATSDAELATMNQRASAIRLRPRSVAALEALVGRAGWKIARLVERPLSRNVQLIKA